MQIPRLRQWREFRGMTQQELAAASSVSLRSIAGYERGSEVRPNTARKLANALSIEVADLLSEAAAPKAARRSPFEPSFDDALAVERRVVKGSAHLRGTGKLEAAGKIIEDALDDLEHGRVEEGKAKLRRLRRELEAA